MTAQIIDGKLLAQQIRQEVKLKTEQLAQSHRAPGLAVIVVGEDPASQVYVRNKVKACSEVGFHSILEAYPANTSEAELLSHIQRLNQADEVDGILVQLPLPSHIDEQKVIAAIAVEKDIDGFHMQNVGALVVGAPGLRPCTPYGCIKMLESTHVDLAGKHAVIIGRSNIVGKPMALMLLEKNTTVTICHSKTKNLKEMVLQADIIISAVGRINTVTADMVKPGAIAIDVGINRTPDGKLCGDIDFEGVKEIAGWITPVPGGVGPMTITMLLDNTLKAAQKRLLNTPLV